MIALMVFEARVVFANSAGHSVEYKSIPTLDLDPIKNPSNRDYERKDNYIAEGFRPIVVLVHSLYDEPDFRFYLPIYILHRLNRFFLVI